MWSNNIREVLIEHVSLITVEAETLADAKLYTHSEQMMVSVSNSYRFSPKM